MDSIDGNYFTCITNGCKLSNQYFKTSENQTILEGEQKLSHDIKFLNIRDGPVGAKLGL